MVEELFYRGLFLRSLTKRGMSPGAAVLLELGGVRSDPLPARSSSPACWSFGLVAGALAVRTGRLGGAIWAHIGFNMTTVVLLYLGS